MRTVLVFASLLITGLTAAPALAQQTDRVLVIYGTDKCPTNASGEEIVVCARRPEGERFRIPKEFRQSGDVAPNNESWAARAQGTTDAGSRTGAESCSAVGPGGFSGCYNRQSRAARAERKGAKFGQAAPE